MSGLRILHIPATLERDGWRKLLNEFGSLLSTYERTSLADWKQHDVGYWYGERSLTGLLTAAACRLRGGISLEEFEIRRGPARKSRAGRSDAWIRLPLKGRWYNVEAKLSWAEQD